jgi:ribonuclease Z
MIAQLSKRVQLMLEVIFLGTGGSVPTVGPPRRNHPAIAIKHQGHVILLDAGEDVQRQLARGNIGLNKPMSVFISHMHADHILGLPGLLLRFALLGRQRPLRIYGPPELIPYIKTHQKTINLGTTFETTIHGIEGGAIFELNYLTVRSFEVEHRGFALGYEVVFQRPTGKFFPEKAEQLGIPKGPLWSKLSSGESVVLDNGREVHPHEVTGRKPAPLKIVYSGDTRPCSSLRKAATDANLLICEAMYTSEHADLAEERGHMTAVEAATLALECNVKLLALTHYSPRYENGEEIITESQDIFQQSVLARDFMRINLDIDGAYEILEPKE